MRLARLLPLAFLAATGACVLRTNGAADGGDAGQVPGCDPMAAPDDCQTGGEACTPDYTQSSQSGFTCQPPGPFFACLPEVGCAASNLKCVEADAGVAGFCVQTCADTSDCSDPFTLCLPLVSGGPTYCLPNYCQAFWQPCVAQSGDGGDGTCVFVGVDPTQGSFGVCLQAGGVPLNGGCAYYRGDGGDRGSQLCASGTVCMLTNGDAPTGLCMALCDALADGGPACNGTCLESIPPAPPPALSLLDFTQGGACASACDAMDACSAPYTCEQLVSTGQLLCVP